MKEIVSLGTITEDNFRVRLKVHNMFRIVEATELEQYYINKLKISPGLMGEVFLPIWFW